MELISRLDGTPISINIEPNIHYGFLLSGGLDSAVLLYLCLMDAKQKGFQPDIRPYNFPKDSGYLWVPKIINYLREKSKMDIPDFTLLSNPSDVGHRQKSSVATKEMYDLYKPDICVMATTQNPDELEAVAIERWGENGYNIRVPPASSKYWFPFFHLTKDHTVDLLFQYELEPLMDITHSCTMQLEGRCNTCFQCVERIWAFEKLGKIDTGIN